jgi:hypothetical protein
METKAISRIKPHSGRKRGDFFRKALPLVATACILASNPCLPDTNFMVTHEDTLKVQKQIHDEFMMIKASGFMTLFSGLVVASLIFYAFKIQTRKE